MNLRAAIIRQIADYLRANDQFPKYGLSGCGPYTFRFETDTKFTVIVEIFMDCKLWIAKFTPPNFNDRSYKTNEVVFDVCDPTYTNEKAVESIMSMVNDPGPGDTSMWATVRIL